MARPLSQEAKRKIAAAYLRLYKATRAKNDNGIVGATTLTRQAAEEAYHVMVAQGVENITLFSRVELGQLMNEFYPGWHS